MKKIGIIGAGKHAQMVHLPLYTTLPGYEVCAIADMDRELARRVAARHGIPRAHRSHAEMLAAEKLDAVIAILPGMAEHERVLTDVLESGNPLLVEKPLCWNSAAGTRLTRLARERQVPLMVGYHKRSDPATQAAVARIRKWKQTGEMGRMTYVRVFISHDGDWTAGAYRAAMTGSAVLPKTDPFAGNPAGFSTGALGKAGSVMGAHSHQLDLMRCLLGESYRVAHAEATGRLLAIESQSGIPGIFEFTPYPTPDEWVEYAVICFEKGYLRIDLPAPLAVNRAGTLEIYRSEGPDGPTRTFPTFPAKSAMHAQAESFLDFLEGRPCSLSPAEEAAEVIEVAEAWLHQRYPNLDTPR